MLKLSIYVKVDMLSYKMSMFSIVKLLMLCDLLFWFKFFESVEGILALGLCLTNNIWTAWRYILASQVTNL